jgi:mannose-1-phosphate guanylyltransferase
MQIIINAGGQGTRLWPVSTKELPKQFCKILGENSLLENTVIRLLKDFANEQIWININENHREYFDKSLPDFKNVLTEPERRDTFAAVISHAAVVAHKSGRDEPIIFLNSDHHIAPDSSVNLHNLAFLEIAKTLQNQDFDLIVCGIVPTWPSSQYGYIEINPEDSKTCSEKPAKVLSFKEKPDTETAEKYLATKNYLWNFGSFAFTFNSLIKILEKVQPESAKIVEQIYQKGKIELEDFSQLPKTSFDYAVLEVADNLGIMGMQLEIWDDIGGFDTLYKYLPEVLDIETESYKQANHIQVAGLGNKIQTYLPGKKVAFVGVSGLIVVETPEGLIICDPKKASNVKKVSQYFEE